MVKNRLRNRDYLRVEPYCNKGGLTDNGIRNLYIAGLQLELDFWTTFSAIIYEGNIITIEANHRTVMIRE